MKSVDEKLFAPIQAHALKQYPNESAGFVIDGHIKDGRVFGEYVPLENISPYPELTSVVSKQDIKKYLGRVTALVHSHPDGHACPSASDMVTQVSWAVPSIIVATRGINCYPPFAFGDQLGRRPLMMRPFRHGVTDCYDAIRDYHYIEFGHDLPNFPRDWEWWSNGKDLYTQGFPQANFRDLTPDETPEVGDVFLVAIGRAGTINHGGIYVGDGRIFHHVGNSRRGPYAPACISMIDSASRWSSYQPRWLRYQSNPQ